MCTGGGNDPLTKSNAEKQASAYRAARSKAVSGGDYDANALGAKPADWDTWDAGTKDRWLKFRTTDEAKAKELEGVYGAQGISEFGFKGVLGDQYTDPTTGLRAGAGPLAPDATDKAIQKARTSAWYRSQMGNNQKSSMAASKLGGFDVNKPVLGGY